MIAVDIQHDLAAVDRHRAEWVALFDASRCELSASYEWVRAMCDSHVRRGETFHLVVLRRDGEVQGLVPLVASRESLAGLSLVTLSPLMERYRTHSDLLLANADAALVDGFVTALRTLPVRWDLFRMAQVLDANPLLAAVEGAASRAGAPIRLRREPPSFFLPLPDTYDAWLSARSSKFRNHLRRMEKKLAATGALRTVAVGPDDDLDAAFTQLLAIEEQSWKHAHGTAISAIQRQARFYRDMSGAMQTRGRLHLTFLLRDDTPIAYNLGVVARNQYAYLKTSFVESLKPLGPATVLRARLIASLIDEGVEALDFPAEPYDWEAQWTSEHRPHHSVTLYNRTLRGRGLALMQRLRDRRRAQAADGEMAYADARALKPPSEDE